MPFPARDRLWINGNAQLGFLMMKSDPISILLTALPRAGISLLGTALSLDFVLPGLLLPA